MAAARALLVVAVAAMLVLAGCSGDPNTTTNATDATNAPGGTTTPGGATTPGGGTTATGNAGALAGVDTPAWMTASSVNATRLVGAHDASLEGTSYRARTYQNSSGLFSLERRGVHRVGENGDAIYRYETRSAAGNATTNAFVNDTWVLTRHTNATRTVFSDYRVTGTASSLSYSPQLETFVRLGDFAANRSFQVDGETRIEYVATSAANEASSGSIPSFDGRLVVSPDGRIHELDVTATQVSSYGNSTIRFTFSLAKVGGVDASTPGWVSTARERATTVDLSYAYDGTVLRVTHEGGDTVAAGTQVVVSPTEGSGPVYARLPESFEPGETMHLAATSERELAVSFDGRPGGGVGLAGPIRFGLYSGNGEVVVRTTLDSTTNGTAAMEPRRSDASVHVRA